jgi:hypothetical protein
MEQRREYNRRWVKVQEVKMLLDEWLDNDDDEALRRAIVLLRSA